MFKDRFRCMEAQVARFRGVIRGHCSHAYARHVVGNALACEYKMSLRVWKMSERSMTGRCRIDMPGQNALCKWTFECAGMIGIWIPFGRYGFIIESLGFYQWLWLVNAHSLRCWRIAAVEGSPSLSVSEGVAANRSLCLAQFVCSYR